MQPLLSPDSRRLYTDCFRAPARGVFDCAVGTTFSLDFEAFLYVPLALASGGFEDPAAALREPVSLLQGINRVSERLTVFCQDGHSNAPGIHLPLLGLLEDCYVPALPFNGRGHGAIFHPKLWLMRFRGAEDDSVLLRAVVLSRNLTMSRSWDTLVVLEGTPNTKKSVPESAGLVRLVRSLPDLAVGAPPSNARREQIEELAAEAERTEFLAPAPFNEGSRVQFVALGLGDKQKWMPEGGDRVLAMSPFLSDGALRTVADLAPKRVLISREEALDALKAETLATWECKSLYDTADADAEGSQTEAGDKTADSLPHGLHAKALAVDAGKTTTWWLGSANLTDAVMNATNVELLIRLEGPTRRVGIDCFLNGGFGTFLRPYEAPAEQAPPDDDDEARRLAESVRAAFVTAPMEGACSPEGEGLWSLRLRGEVTLPEGVRVEAWPLTLPAAQARPWTGQGVGFSGLSPEGLTAFIAFRVEAEAASVLYRVAFTRKVPVEGFPEDRRSHIVRSVIRDRNGFLSYLQRVLAGVEGDLMARLAADAKRHGDPDANGRPGGNPALLENMLRALRRDPARLDAIGRTIEGLTEVGARGEEVVPGEFLRLWELVREARAGLVDHAGAVRTRPSGGRS